MAETSLQCAIGGIKNDVPVEKRAKILKTLIESGANPNQKIPIYYGYTPLDSGWAEFGELEMAKILFGCGC